MGCSGHHSLSGSHHQQEMDILCKHFCSRSPFRGVCVCVPQVESQVSPPVDLYLMCWDSVSHWTWNLLYWLVWLAGQWGLKIFPYLTPSARAVGVHHHAWRLSWMLGIWTHILMLAQLVLYPRSHLPRLCLYYLECFVYFTLWLMVLFTSPLPLLLLFLLTLSWSCRTPLCLTGNSG